MQHLIVQSDFEVDNPDIILRSSASKSGQETDFRARVQDFTNASSVFGDAFAAAIGHETGQNGLPVVRMQESQATLKGFLAFVHNEPGQMPDLDNMPPSELLDLWDASHKYNVAMLQMVVALQLRFVAFSMSRPQAEAVLMPGTYRVYRNRCLSGNANGHLALKLLARSGGNGSFANAQAALNHLVSLDPTTLPHALLEMCDSSSLATLVSS